MHKGQGQLFLLLLLAICLGVDAGLGPWGRPEQGTQASGDEGLEGYRSPLSTPALCLSMSHPLMPAPLSPALSAPKLLSQAYRCLFQEPRAGTRRSVCWPT